MPWPRSSVGTPAHGHRVEAVEAVGLGDRVGLAGRVVRRGIGGRGSRIWILPEVGHQVLVRRQRAGIDHADDDVRGARDRLPGQLRMDVVAGDAAIVPVLTRVVEGPLVRELGIVRDDQGGAVPDKVRLHVVISAGRLEPADRRRHRVPGGELAGPPRGRTAQSGPAPAGPRPVPPCRWSGPSPASAWRGPARRGSPVRSPSRSGRCRAAGAERAEASRQTTSRPRSSQGFMRKDVAEGRARCGLQKGVNSRHETNGDDPTFQEDFRYTSSGSTRRMPPWARVAVDRDQFSCLRISRGG